jgi:hypothetical protein
MSTSKSKEAQSLTWDEQILHHHTAMIKTYLEAYYANPQDQDWNNVFGNSLVHLIYLIYFHRPFSDYPERGHEPLSQFL